MAIEYIEKSKAMKPRERKSVAVDQALDRIYEVHGTVTTDLVLEEARDSEHPLHKYFEWDDSVAAEKYRKAQATAIIMASKFVAVLTNNRNGPPDVNHAQPVEVRRFVSSFRGEGFKMRKDALANDEGRAAFIEKRISVLRSWCRSTVDVVELKEIREVVLKAIGN